MTNENIRAKCLIAYNRIRMLLDSNISDKEYVELIQNNITINYAKEENEQAIEQGRKIIEICEREKV